MTIDHRQTDSPSKNKPDGHDSLDELLVMRWQDGNAEAMDQLVGRWQGRLWRHARRLTDTNEEAWDVMQDAWLAMLRAIRRLDDPGRFKYWAFRIVSNKAVDRIRWKGRKKVASLPVEKELADTSRNEVTRLDQTDQIMSLISGLSIEHRTVISLRYAEELSIAEIANSLGIKPGTVKSRLHYALQAIRQKMDR